MRSFPLDHYRRLKMARTRKPKTTDTVYQINAGICFEITHGYPTSSTLVKDFPHGKVVRKVEVYKDKGDNFYLVLKD
jgi:hypothetical protein